MIALPVLVVLLVLRPMAGPTEVHPTLEDRLAAEVAGGLTSEEPAILLAIAWHETRYTSNYVQPESGDPVTGEPRWSCGVMTPEPTTAPCVDKMLVEQYLDGARHLALWRKTYAGDRALDAYAGGNWLARGCAVGAVVRRGRDLCQFARDMRARASWVSPRARRRIALRSRGTRRGYVRRRARG